MTAEERLRAAAEEVGAWSDAQDRGEIKRPTALTATPPDSDAQVAKLREALKREHMLRVLPPYDHSHNSICPVHQLLADTAAAADYGDLGPWRVLGEVWNEILSLIVEEIDKGNLDEARSIIRDALLTRDPDDDLDARALLSNTESAP